jgi:hypothetical protein
MVARLERPPPHALRHRTSTPAVGLDPCTPFNITCGFDENGDTSFTDRPAGLRRNSDLPASLYAQIPNGNRCVQNFQSGGQAVTLLQYLQRNHPNGVRAEGPGSFNASMRLSKSFSFGKRMVTAADRATQRNEKGRAANPRAANRAEKVATKATTAPDRETGRFNLQFSVQISNLFNRVNFGQYGGVLGSPYFGLPNSAGGARSFELSTRFSF